MPKSKFWSGKKVRKWFKRSYFLQGRKDKTISKNKTIKKPIYTGYGNLGRSEIFYDKSVESKLQDENFHEFNLSFHEKFNKIKEKSEPLKNTM